MRRPEAANNLVLKVGRIGGGALVAQAAHDGQATIYIHFDLSEQTAATEIGNVGRIAGGRVIDIPLHDHVGVIEKVCGVAEGDETKRALAEEIENIGLLMRQAAAENHVAQEIVTGEAEFLGVALDDIAVAKLFRAGLVNAIGDGGVGVEISATHAEYCDKGGGGSARGQLFRFLRGVFGLSFETGGPLAKELHLVGGLRPLLGVKVAVRRSANSAKDKSTKVGRVAGKEAELGQFALRLRVPHREPVVFVDLPVDLREDLLIREDAAGLTGDGLAPVDGLA